MKKELLGVTKKSGIVFIGKIISLAFGMLFNFIVARYIGASVYGSFMYVYTLISFFPLISKLGLDQGLVSFIPKLTEESEIEKRNSLITFVFIINIIISVVLSIIFIFNSDFIAINILNNKGSSGILKILSPLILFLSFIKLSKGLFRGIGNIEYFIKGKNIISPSFKVIIILITYFLGYKLYGIVASFYISIILTCLYFLIVIKKFGFFKKISFKYTSIYKEVILFSFPLLLNGVLGFFINKTDTFMIGYFLSGDKVGIYNIALRIGTMSSFVLTAFNTMFAPMISSLYHRGEMEKLAKMYKVITKWILGTNLIAFFLILLFSKEIMHIFGTEFIVGSKALILISIGQIVNAGVGSAGYINIMTGNPQYEFYNSFLTVGINITLNYLLIPIYGFEGAAVASLVSIAITNIIKLLLVFKEHRIHPYNIDYIKMLFVLTVSFIIINVINNYIVFNWLIRLVGLSICFILLFVLIYYWLGLSKEDKIIYEAILSKFNN